MRSNVRHEPRARRETWSSDRPSGRRGISGRSGSKPLDLPSRLVARREQQPVVPAILAMLPELEPLRRQAEAAPGFRERHVDAGVALGELLDALLEPLAARDRA